ncbi:MAG: hypothetical protein IT437_12490 [Phycisphaerales bacterium]|nr:hypothetical protein [Phycisphaerales bacterium]
MRRDTTIQLLAAGLLGLMLVGSGVLATQISASAGRNRLGYTDEPTEGAPIEVAAGIAMGAFRGIFVNLLWMRANDLKESGRYYEANELSRAITKLEPRFPQVWVFHAWNMAYNISVATHTFPERWRWVQAGISLLRDEGIPTNPNDLLLHKELAYLFLHKIQGYMDDANGYYKRQLAVEWQVNLGPPPTLDAATLDRASATKAYADWLAPIVEAPDTLDGVYARAPAARDLVALLRDHFRITPDAALLSVYEANRAVRNSGQHEYLIAHMKDRNKEMAALCADPAMKPAWDALLPFVRKRVLIDGYHMEPDRMLRYTQRFGPLDWRHPAAHGLYWAVRGTENAITRVEDRNRLDYDFTNADRVVMHALQELWRSGELYFDFMSEVYNPDRQDIFYMTLPSPYFVETYGEVLASLRDRSRFDVDSRPFSVYSAGYENFLIEATRFFYRRGQFKLAEKYYHQAAVYPHANQNDPDRARRFSKPLADFVYDESPVDEYTRPAIAVQEVMGALQGAYVRGLMVGNEDEFRRQFEFAKQAHLYFMTKQRNISNMNPEMSRMDLMPADFRLLAARVFAELIGTLDPDHAETLYDNAPEDLKRYGYLRIKERFKPTFDELAKEGGRTFDQVFPEPPGMDAFLVEMRQLEAADAAARAPAIQAR